MISYLLLSICFIQIKANVLDNRCSTSLFTRKRCGGVFVISNKQACETLGCCFDETNVPILAKCYQKARTLSFGSFYFTATIPPTGVESQQGIRTVGGTITDDGTEYPGSKIILQCSRYTRCLQSKYYRDTRSSCERQGCCWRNGRCMQNQYLIISLRDKCPPGYKDPPKCVAVEVCEESNPCLVGETCVNTAPGAHKCECADPSKCECTAPTVTNGKVIVDGSEVSGGSEIANGKSFTLECNAGYIVVPSQSSTSSRKCSLGDISPSGPYECKLADVVFDGYFIVSHQEEIEETKDEDCFDLTTDPDTENVPQSEAVKFAEQLAFIKELENEHIFADDQLIRFGVYNSNAESDPDPATKFILRTLLQQNTHSLDTLFSPLQMTCFGPQKFLDAYKYITSERFHTNGRENPRFIYYFTAVAGTGTDDNWSQTIQNFEVIEANMQKKVFVFVISLKPRGSPEFDAIKTWAEQRFDPDYTFTGQIKPRGLFVGTTQEPASTLMTELRKNYALIKF